MRYAAGVCAAAILMIGLAGCGTAGGGEPSSTKEPEESPSPSESAAESDSEALPEQQKGAGVPEVTMSLGGTAVPLDAEQIECEVASGRIAYTFVDPHADGGIDLSFYTDPLTVDSLYYVTDDVMLGPYFEEEAAEALQATVSGDAVVVTGTVENKYGEHESLDLRIEAVCKT